MSQIVKKIADIKTKYGTFRCVFEPERDMGGYVATAPAVQGVVSWGKNLAHAKEMVAECIEGMIETRIIMEAVKEGNIRFTANAKRMPSFA
jgi:predicted RNase H-like HicB family nuclease